MYFLYRRDIDKYITIHREDVEHFNEIINSEDIFKTSNKFELISDKATIKNILEEKYSSKNRGGEYMSGLPSATLISSALFPYDLDKYSKKNKIMLLKWANDVSVEDYKAQQITNKLSTDSGTYLHKILEVSLTDRETRNFDKQKSIEKYIEIANNDSEVLNCINNFEDRKQYFVDMAKNTLKKFFAEEIQYIDPVFNELFIQNKYIQGSIDGIFYNNNQLCIYDWKTSKKSNSQKSLYDKYAKQLYIYSRMLLRAGVISKKEYNHLGFKIGFFNWNSGKSSIYEYSKEDIDKSSAYVNFILSWYWSIKNDREEKIEL